MQRFFRQALIWAARILAALVILLIFFYAEENWRGARAWAACEKELAAKGESLDLHHLLPPTTSDGDLSKAPFFADLYDKPEDLHEHPFQFYVFHWPLVPNPSRVQKVDVFLNSDWNVKRPDFPSVTRSEHFDLNAWQKFYRSQAASNSTGPANPAAQDILSALSQFQPALTSIDEAVSPPQAHWPLDAERLYITNLDGNLSMYRVAMVLDLRGVAHLENHEGDDAEKDFLFCLRLNRPLEKNCVSLNYTVISSDLFRAEDLLWEGLSRHIWTGPQLKEMEEALAREDMLALAQRTLRIDRAANIAVLDFVRQGGADTLRKLGGVGEFDKYGYYTALKTLNYRPGGEWDEDKAALARAVQLRIDAIDPVRGVLNIDSFPFDLQGSGFGWSRLYVYLTSISVPVTDSFLKASAFDETERRCAILACRLEEFRISRGHYPENLDELPSLPAHLNQEVFNENPLHYSPKGDGYLLYSVGWDQKDDEGVPNTNKNDQKGDWVWPSP